MPGQQPETLTVGPTSSPERRAMTVALLGNPNTGKSSIFNALAGIRQKTGNYPGVTIEKRTGRFQVDRQNVDLVDLPGTYSLAPSSPDEMLTVNVLLGRERSQTAPDAVVCVLDASNLERNLFLTSQLLELNLPIVVALNMTDVAARKGISIDVERLSQVLGVPVVPVMATRRMGIPELKLAIAALGEQRPRRSHEPFSVEVQQALQRLEQSCPADWPHRRFTVTRLLLDTDGFMIRQLRDRIDQGFGETLSREKSDLRTSGSLAEIESAARYQWIQQQLSNVVTSSPSTRVSWIDRIDHLLTHPVLGLIIAAVVMVFVFQIVFWAAEPASTAIDWLTGTATEGVDWIFVALIGQPEGALHSLLVDGLIAGVGAVLIFLPQIVLLFLILALLEDSGYLARLAFLTDKYLSRLGLSGITLIPLLSSFACAVPGIMATRIIKNERERLITILIAPLMSCSARLPVYTLMIAAFVPATTYYGFGLQGLTMFAMYLVGIVTAIVVAWALKQTMLPTGTSSFVMELPTYKLPTFRNVGHKVYEGGAAFVRDAGTIIVAATIIVWAAAYFPRSSEQLPAGLLDRQIELTQQLETVNDPIVLEKLVAEQSVVSNQIDGLYLRNSYLGRAGRLIEPIVQPLGWDWRIGSAAIASFPAREVLVSTMGVLFGLGGDVDSEKKSNSLKSTLQQATWDQSDRPLFTLPVALSVMVFFALCAQCVSTLAVIKRETRSWFWPAFTFTYMTGLAYFAAFVTFQVSNWMVG